MAVVPIFHATVTQDARLVLDERERDQRRVHLSSLVGRRVEVVVRKERTQRSLDQNAYLHAVPFALLAEYWGEDIESTKLLCLGECFGWRDTRDGRQIPLKPSTSALTTDEGSHLIEWLLHGPGRDPCGRQRHGQRGRGPAAERSPSVLRGCRPRDHLRRRDRYLGMLDLLASVGGPMQVTCGCGCGGATTVDERGRARKFVTGHRVPVVARVKVGATSKSTGYYRSKQLIPVTERCSLEDIGGCNGSLQRAHLDGNPLNNVASNVRVFCNSHHFLYDNGRIDLANPVMPEFFVSGGSRRYRPRLQPRTCKLTTCGKPFTSESASQRYCSEPCASIAREATHAAARRRYEDNNRGCTWQAPCR